ncbi:MAG TPA: VOC family protein, partial [Rhizomicrobium sp.]
MARPKNTEFDFAGINHLALVCKDMDRTVDFYSNVLGMPLIKTIELPRGMGQHFFFDVGNGDCIAFFWFANAPEAQPGVASAKPGPLPGPSAHGSMNHVAINV